MSRLLSMPWPGLGAEEELANLLFRVIAEERGDAAPEVADEENLRLTVSDLVGRVVQNPTAYGVPPSVAGRLTADEHYRDAVVTATMARASRLWPLSLLIYMLPGVEEITCFGSDRWTVRLRGTKAMLNGAGPFVGGDQEVIALFRRVISMRGVTGNRSLTEAEPLAEVMVGTVLRLSCAIDPVVSSASHVIGAVRLPQISRITSLADYVQQGVFPPGVADFLNACVQARLNILIAGGTATGKTTLLRVLAGLIPDNETVVVIEKGSELHLESDREPGIPWVPLCIPLATIPDLHQHSQLRTSEAGIAIGDLVVAALRYTPDRIILGEARGSEMAECCSAMTTGHEGSLLTIHADSARLAVRKAAQLVMRHQDFRGNPQLAETLVEDALEVVVHLKHARDGGRRLSGVVAVGEGGNLHVIYEQKDSDVLERRTRSIHDTARLAERLRGVFPGDEFPLP
ncbi:MAG: ATPase, T2SS/T4P/T4SS family [Candidatus Dormibacteria bacterium]